MTEIRDDDAALFAFCRDNEDRYLDVMAERADTELVPLIPRLDLATTRAPGEGWSMPPGALAASWATERGEAIDGGKTLDLRLNVVYRFARKHRHGIRPVITDWLGAQVGRPVP